MVYFTLLLPATYFDSIRVIFRVKYYLLKKVILLSIAILAVDNNITLLSK